jgi:MSHA biogenesis protein MshI
MTKNAIIKKITGLFSDPGLRAHVCLEIRLDGIAWAFSSRGLSPVSGFEACLPASRDSALRSLVEKHAWSGAMVTPVLPLDQYQVFQMERPEGLEDSELSDALKWKLKDFLDFSPSDAVTDVFPFPEDAFRGRGTLVNVVAARLSVVTELITLIQASGMELDRIDISELAMRNIVSRLDQNKRGAALVHLSENYGQMIICRDKVLYLSRRLDVSQEDLRDASRQENAIQSLALEMQRSLDYYESQLGQVPPSVIRLVAHDSSLPMASMLGAYVAAGVEELNWSSIGFETAADSRCLPAIGASLSLSGDNI